MNDLKLQDCADDERHMTFKPWSNTVDVHVTLQFNDKPTNIRFSFYAHSIEKLRDWCDDYLRVSRLFNEG